MNGGKKRLLVGAIAVVLVAAAVAVVLIIRSTSEKPVAHGPQPLAGHDVCGYNLVVNFKTDDQMQTAAPAMAADPQIRRVFTETKHEAWQRYQKIFAHQPDLIAVGSERALSPSLTILPAEGVNLYALRDRLTSQITQADKVNAYGPGELAELMTKLPPSTGKPEPCPASGER
ncbi:permease-like cell division protein FtsX [Actinocrispum sp. NPDC049592]|uniref:permease-like cell division protein FtsX n=1 Tax=Actinocrispum sp. NPDC049592 TaxID=3154835 RepID=UPI00343386BB